MFLYLWNTSLLSSIERFYCNNTLTCVGFNQKVRCRVSVYKVERSHFTTNECLNHEITHGLRLFCALFPWYLTSNWYGFKWENFRNKPPFRTKSAARGWGVSFQHITVLLTCFVLFPILYCRHPTYQKKKLKKGHFFTCSQLI